MKTGLDPFYRKKTGEKDLPLRAFATYLERHLDPAHHNQRRARKGKGPLGDHVFLGTYGGRRTTHVLADLDNHTSLGKTAQDGVMLKIADLDLAYLSLVKRAYDLPRRPDVIVTSSRSLGLYFFYKLDTSQPTYKANRELAACYVAAGLPQVEIYPQPPREDHPQGTGPRCNRRPFGHGSYTLTNKEIIRPWRRQTSHYLSPTPLPTFGRLVDHLIDLWQQQVATLRRTKSRPEIVAHVDRQVDLVRQWMGAGCPLVEKVVGTEVTSAKATCPQPTATVLPRVKMPEEWVQMPIHERVYRLATEGLPCGGSLNWALYTVAKHLLNVELSRNRDRMEIARDVLVKFCEAKHNGFSSRLDGEVSNDVRCLIERTLVNASKIEIKTSNYRFPLRARWLICREGELNDYNASRVNTGNSSSVLPPSSSRDHFLVSPLEGDGKGDISAYAEKIRCKVEAGHFDMPLPETMQLKIKTIGLKANALPFLTRLANYLGERGGTARISRQLMYEFYKGRSDKQITKYKAIGMAAGLFTVSGRATAHKQSTEYTLGQEEALVSAS